jgi:hypothetical protein
MGFTQAQGCVELQIREHMVYTYRMKDKETLQENYTVNPLQRICDKLSPKPVQEKIHVCS